jgi:hypothetical protein
MQAGCFARQHQLQQMVATQIQISGQEQTISFGAYPEISRKVATERREQARALAVNGTDPSEDRKEKKLATISQVRRAEASLC